ncbi:MAG: hypothetical protein M9958_02400 [Chitinophagales bacterium]|nr:hypothetical protein [Chitinophagales bacterium]
MRKKILSLCAIAFFASYLSAQDFLGLRIGNYAGVHGLTINPAINVNGPKQISVNFLSFGMSFESNYIYLEKSNILLAALKMGKLRPNPAIKMDRKKISNPLYYNYFDRRGTTYNFYSNAFVNFPSGIMNVRNHSFGLTFSDKFLGYVNRISPDYGYYYYQDSATTEMWLDPMKVGLLHYGELAFNYATKVPTAGKLDLNFGITAKYLMPWDAVFLRNNVRKETIKIENGIKMPENSNVDFNWASSYHYDYENDKPVYKLRKKGNGIGLDFGITLVDSYTNEGQASRWKIGLAVLDVGKTFIKGESNLFITVDTAIYRDEFFSNVKDLDSFRAIANYYAFNGDMKHSVTGDRFSVWMPMSFSFFSDFNVGASNWYLSLHSILRMPMKAIGLEKSNTIALSARIEKPNFELAFPIILHEFKYPRAGLFFRKGVFFIGSDNMTAWIVPQKLNGMELYMGFKWSGNQVYKSKNKRPNLKNMTLKCPVW